MKLAPNWPSAKPERLEIDIPEIDTKDESVSNETL